MKKIVVLLVAAFALGASAAPAGAGKTRVETFTYNGPGQFDTDRVTIWIGPGCIGSDDQCVGGSNRYATSKRERAISVSIADETGGNVRGVIVQGDNLRKYFCGASGKVPIKGGKEVVVWVSARPCPTNPDGVATTGTVTTKFFD